LLQSFSPRGCLQVLGFPEDFKKSCNTWSGMG